MQKFEWLSTAPTGHARAGVVTRRAKCTEPHAYPAVRSFAPYAKRMPTRSRLAIEGGRTHRPCCGMLPGMDPVAELTSEGHASAFPFVYDDQDIDRSLIWSALERTPTECLELIEAMLELVESVRRVDQSLR